MKYVLRKKVFDQTDEIFLYYMENESVKRADKVVKSILNTIDKIAANPVHYPKHPKYTHLKADTRKHAVHKTYIITFRIFKTHIAILDVYHGKRKPV